MNLFRRLFLVLVSFIPAVALANASVSEPAIEYRTPDASWDLILNKLINNRMPESYYELLSANGIVSLEQLLALDGSLKRQIMEKYRIDRNIMLASSGTRSAF